MKRKTIIILSTLFILTVLAGCKKDLPSTENTITAKQGMQNKQESVRGDSTQEEKPKPVEAKLITDASKWNHPVSEIFKKYDVKVIKVEFKNNNTYPIFYVTISKNELAQNRDFFLSSLITEVAHFNGYWSYSIIDNDLKIDVDCDNKTIKKVTLNGSEYNLLKFGSDYSAFDGEYFDEKYIYMGKEEYSLKSKFDGANGVVAFTVNNASGTVINSIAKLEIGSNDVYVASHFLSSNKILAHNGVGDMYFDTRDYSIQIDSHKFYKKGYIDKLRKAYQIVSQKYNAYYENIGKAKPDDYSDFTSYAVYEGLSEDGKITIGVRRSRDTVIETWVHVDPNTFEYEDDNG